MPAESVRLQIFCTDLGSISGEPIFFSVARTTPFVAAGSRAGGGGTRAGQSEHASSHAREQWPSDTRAGRAWSL